MTMANITHTMFDPRQISFRPPVLIQQPSIGQLRLLSN